MKRRNEHFIKEPATHLVMSGLVVAYGLMHVDSLKLKGMLTESRIHSVLHVASAGGLAFLATAIVALVLTRKRWLVAGEVLLSFGVMFVTLPALTAVKLLPDNAPTAPYLCVLIGGYIALTALSVIVAQQILKGFMRAFGVEIFSEEDAARAVLELNRRDDGRPN